MRFREPPPTRTYKLFLSSSNETAVRSLRRRVKLLVEDVINPLLLDEYPQSEVEVRVVMWERGAAQRLYGESINEYFARRVQECEMTLVLLYDELKDGTEAELEAALADPEQQVALLSFKPSTNLDPKRQQKLRRTLKKYEDRVIYQELGPPASETAWIGVSRAVFAFALSAIRTSDPRARDVMLSEVR